MVFSITTSIKHRALRPLSFAHPTCSTAKANWWCDHLKTATIKPIQARKICWNWYIQNATVEDFNLTCQSAMKINSNMVFFLWIKGLYHWTFNGFATKMILFLENWGHWFGDPYWKKASWVRTCLLEMSVSLGMNYVFLLVKCLILDWKVAIYSSFMPQTFFPVPTMFFQIGMFPFPIMTSSRVVFTRKEG